MSGSEPQKMEEEVSQPVGWLPEQLVTSEPDVPEETLEDLRQRAAQLESYAADFSRTYAELRRYVQPMTILHEVNARIALALYPDDVLTTMLSSLEHLVPYESASVYLLNVSIERAGQSGHGIVTGVGPLRLRTGRTRSGEAVEHFAGSVAEETSPAAEAVQIQATVTRRIAPSGVDVAVPLRATSRIIGVLDVHVATELSTEQVQIVEFLATFVAVALQNAYLYEETERLATTDPLTGLSNYRRFQDVLELEIERARRVSYPLGFLMIDIDHFKIVNDEHGHQAGNMALQAVAETISSRLRRTDVIARLGDESDDLFIAEQDVVARLGGEEFGVILANASAAQVQIVGEKLRRSVEALPAVHDDPEKPPSPLTISVGGVSLDPQEATSERLLRYADHALYKAKQTGRNRVCLWSELEGRDKT